ncbi:hypothetical protein COEX109129_02090 [Corallococcus exiguus]
MRDSVTPMGDARFQRVPVCHAVMAFLRPVGTREVEVYEN